METFIPLLISIASAAFFSGMETAFASSNKMRFEMKKKDNLPSRILSVFFSHPKDFISTMWMGYTVSLVIYGILMTRFIEGYIPADVTMNRGAFPCPRLSATSCSIRSAASPQCCQ